MCITSMAINTITSYPICLCYVLIVIKKNTLNIKY